MLEAVEGGHRIPHRGNGIGGDAPYGGGKRLRLVDDNVNGIRRQNTLCADPPRHRWVALHLFELPPELLSAERLDHQDPDRRHLRLLRRAGERPQDRDAMNAIKSRRYIR